MNVTEAKNTHFFACRRTGFAHQRLRDFVKITMTRVASHWLWLESSHSDSSRVTIFLNATRVESESPKIVLESSDWLESRYHCEKVNGHTTKQTQ